MSLVHYLSLLAAHHSFSFTASPVRGKSNLIADFLSHFQFQHFHHLAPHTDSILTQIPQQLVSDFLPGKFMLLPNATSWISVLRTIAYLLRDQLFQPVKMCSSISAVLLPILSTIRPLRFTFQRSGPFTLRRVCLLCWLVAFSYRVCCRVSNATKAQIDVSANRHNQADALYLQVLELL